MVQYHQDYLQTKEDKSSRSAHSMGDKRSVWRFITSDLSCEIPKSLQSLKVLAPEISFKVSSLPEKRNIKDLHDLSLESSIEQTGLRPKTSTWAEGCFVMYEGYYCKVKIKCKTQSRTQRKWVWETMTVPYCLSAT